MKKRVVFIMRQQLTSHERFLRMFQHREADRVPIFDSPWKETIDRWVAEGMPNRDYISYFDLDIVGHIGVDNSPQYPNVTIEETDAYVIYKTSWGATLRSWKHQASTPEFIDFTIINREAWADAKARMQPTEDRIPWEYLKKNYPEWKKENRWISAGLWFGFDVAHSWAVGTERLLIAMVEDPEWCTDMFNHYLDVNLALLDRVWDAGYHFQEVTWPDDMGYKLNQFFSMRMYRNLVKPVQKRAIEWAHQKGVYTRLHSCGDIRPFVPELVEIGLDALNPLEVKAGMDPIVLKAEFGNKLVFHGGINAVLWNDKDAITEEIQRVVPVMKQNGGYIFSSDHSIPDSVSLENFTHIINVAKKAGSYE